MNRYLAFLAFVAGLAALCSPVMAQTSVDPVDPGHAHYAWASVTRVDPIYRNVQVANPHQQCQQQAVVRREGGSNTAGTILGAVIGGVLGNTVGKGDGRRAATVAGAVAGGVVGNQVAGRDDRMIQDAVTRCRQVQNVGEERRIVGYNVEYRYRGRVYNSRLGYDPGTRLRVRVTVTPDN